MGQSLPGLGQALSTAGADAELAGEVAHGAGTAFDGAADMTIGNGFAYTNDHGAYCERECE